MDMLLTVCILAGVLSAAVFIHWLYIRDKRNSRPRNIDTLIIQWRALSEAQKLDLCHRAFYELSTNETVTAGDLRDILKVYTGIPGELIYVVGVATQNYYPELERRIIPNKEWLANNVPAEICTYVDLLQHSHAANVTPT